MKNKIKKSSDLTLEVFNTAIKNLATKDDLRGLPTKDDLRGFATKDDLRSLPTKDDLRGFATKDDLRSLPTKDDLRGFATKDDISRLAVKLVQHDHEFAQIKAILETKVNRDEFQEKFDHLARKFTFFDNRQAFNTGRLNEWEPVIRDHENRISALEKTPPHPVP